MIELSSRWASFFIHSFIKSEKVCLSLREVIFNNSLNVKNCPGVSSYLYARCSSSRSLVLRTLLIVAVFGCLLVTICFAESQYSGSTKTLVPVVR